MMNLARIVTIFGAAAVLSACSSGNGNSNQNQRIEPPGPPMVTVTAGIKQLIFNWDAVDGATYYRLMENPDGHSGFTQVEDDIPAGTSSARNHIAVHLHDWVNALYMVQACNSAGCTASIEVSTADHVLDTIGYFKASDTKPGDGFGLGIALSANGNTLAVCGGGAVNVGRVYVFRFDGQSWHQEALIRPSIWSNVFLTDVELSADGNTLAIGAPDYDGDSGDAYVYRFDGTDWIQEVRLDGPDVPVHDPGHGDFFGEAIALSDDGNTLAVGAENTGSAYLFRFDGSEWAQPAIFTGGYVFGEDVAISGDGNTLAIGDPEDESKGSVHVFRFDGADWTQHGHIKAEYGDDGDFFGSVSLSADGNTLLVGAGSEDSSATGINGDQSDNSAYRSGALYVFRFDEANWIQDAYIKASNTEPWDYFSRAVAISADGNTIAAAARRESSSAWGIDGDQTDNSARYSGAVYLFTYDGTSWTQAAYVKAINTDSEDGFGAGLAINADGTALAVGATGEDSAATGVDGDSADNSADKSGAVYIY